MTRSDTRRALRWGTSGAAALIASAAVTRLLPPSEVTVYAIAGFAAFVLCWRNALRITGVDDLVFEHRPLWSPPEPECETQPRAAVRSGARLRAV
jgi:hypothetical protein